MFQDETPRRLQFEAESLGSGAPVAFADAAEGMLDACGLGADPLVEIPPEPVPPVIHRRFPPHISLN